MPFVAEPVGDRHPHVAEEELGRVLGVEADLVEVATPFETRPVGLDDDEAEAPVLLGGVGLGRHDDEIAS